jgi:hypothetical protein
MLNVEEEPETFEQNNARNKCGPGMLFNILM